LNTLIKLTLLATFLLGFVIPFAYYFFGMKSRTRYKRALIGNISAVITGIVIATILAYNPDFQLLAADTALLLKQQMQDSLQGWVILLQL